MKSCDLPVIVCGEKKLVISGLCSVLRYIIQTAQKGDKCSVSGNLASRLKNLLGLRQNCLRACAEVSEWTMYTEVTLPQLVERVLGNKSDTAGSIPPTELLQLENQLAKLPVEPSCRRNQKEQHKAGQSSPIPVVTEENVTEQERSHKDRSNEVNEDLSPSSLTRGKSQTMMNKFDNLKVVDSSEEICHRLFVEGNNVQLTDLVLFVCLQLLLSVKDNSHWCSCLPRIMSWYQRMAADPHIADAMFSAGLSEYYSLSCSVAQGSEIHHASASFSASSSDPHLKSEGNDANFACISGSCNLTSDSVHTAVEQDCIQHVEKTKFRASQRLLDEGIAKATEMGLLREVMPLGKGRCLQLPWEQYPGWVLPCGLGGVPDKRAARKLQQLENIAAAVKELVLTRSTDAIVDFCSGGGHVGILLAYLFPQQQVYTYLYFLLAESDCTEESWTIQWCIFVDT